MTTLILIRHGESQANRQRIFAGHLNADLEVRGLLQAKKTAEYVCANYNIDKVYASDLKRAYNTGKCVSDLLDIPLLTDQNLREIYAGKWDGMKFDDIVKTYPDEYNLWLTDIGNSHTTDGESVADMKDRIVTAMTKIAQENDGKTVAIATHATPIRIMQCFVQYNDLSRMKDIPWVSNASVSVFEYDNGTWSAKTISYDAHLGDLNTVLPGNV